MLSVVFNINYIFSDGSPSNSTGITYYNQNGNQNSTFGTFSSSSGSSIASGFPPNTPPNLNTLAQFSPYTTSQNSVAHAGSSLSNCSTQISFDYRQSAFPSVPLTSASKRSSSDEENDSFYKKDRKGQPPSTVIFNGREFRNKEEAKNLLEELKGLPLPIEYAKMKPTKNGNNWEFVKEEVKIKNENERKKRINNIKNMFYMRSYNEVMTFKFFSKIKISNFYQIYIAIFG